MLQPSVVFHERIPLTHPEPVRNLATLVTRRSTWGRADVMYSSSCSKMWRFEFGPWTSTPPIGSMYGIYTNIGGILMVHVTIYSIHGPYGVYTNHQHLRIRISRSPSDKHHKKTYHKKMRFPGPGPSHPSRDVRLLSESPKVGQCQTRHVQLWEKREPGIA